MFLCKLARSLCKFSEINPESWLVVRLMECSELLINLSLEQCFFICLS